MEMVTAAWATFRTPWGDGGLVMAGDRLLEVRLPGPGAAVMDAIGTDGGPPTALLRLWTERLERYLQTGVPRWTASDVAAEIDALVTTEFRRDVYRALVTIPPGETVAYGELAAMAGRPGAARAVGSAMAANPLALVVPCHRVIRGDGSLGHYGDCDAWKADLLALEGVPLAPTGRHRS